MADTKISALPASTTPLAGTEVLPIVQSGTTKQVSIANLTAGRTISASKAGVGTSTLDATYQPNLQVESAASDGTGGLLIGSYLPTLTLYDYSGGAGASQIQQDGTDFLVKNGGATRFKIGSTGDATLSSGNLIQGTAAKGINFTANTPAAGMTSQLLNWYEEGTWTPAQGSGLTLVGAFSSSGTYVRIGRMVTVTGLLQGATSIAVAAGGVITNNLPYSIGTGNAVGRCLNSAWTSACDIIPSGANLYGATVIGATSYIFFSVTYQV